MGELLVPSLTEAMVGSKAVGEDAHNAGLRAECVQNLCGGCYYLNSDAWMMVNWSISQSI